MLDTKNHLADILTKGNFSSDEWNHLLCLFNIMSFPTFWQALQKFSLSHHKAPCDSSDGSPVAEARPTNLVMHGQCKEDVSPQRSGSLVNPVNDDDRKRVGLPQETGDIPTQTLNFENSK